ncbi:MAG: polysaccharide deacetylase family protein [Thermoplasmata archaeon]|nr:polysaccharide deacetylase family protein [Thermoplasmata archaeon]
MRRTFLLTIDLEEFGRVGGEKSFALSHRGTENLLQVLTRTRLPTTFFATIEFASHYPHLIRRIAQKHEVALHAYDHTHNYRTMEPEEAGDYLRKGKDLLEDMIGQEVYGFRAPRMQAPGMPVLKKAGFRYDSSLHPTFVPGRYNAFRGNRGIGKGNGIVRIPVSVTPGLRLAFSWLWFRTLGVGYAKLCTRQSEKGMDYVCIYFHPWDFVDLRRTEGLPIGFARNTHRSPAMLERYIGWLKKRGYRFSTVVDFLREKGWL